MTRADLEQMVLHSAEVQSKQQRREKEYDVGGASWASCKLLARKSFRNSLGRHGVQLTLYDMMSLALHLLMTHVFCLTIY